MEIENTIQDLTKITNSNEKVLEYVRNWIKTNTDEKYANVKTISKSQIRNIAHYPCFYAAATLLATIIIKISIINQTAIIPVFVLSWFLLLVFFQKTIPQFVPSIRKKFILAAPHTSLHKIIRRSIEEGGIIVYYSPTTSTPIGKTKTLLQKHGQKLSYISVTSFISVGILYKLNEYIQPDKPFFSSEEKISFLAQIFYDIAFLTSIITLILILSAHSANFFSKPDPINNATGITVNLELFRKNIETTKTYNEVPTAIHLFGPIDKPHGTTIMKILNDLGVTPDLMDITIIRFHFIGRGNFVPVLTDQEYPSLIPTLISFALQTSGSLDENRTHLIFPVETKEKIEDPTPWKIKNTEHALISTQAPQTWHWTQITSRKQVTKSPKFFIPPYSEYQPYRLELLLAIIEFFDDLLKEIMGISIDQLEKTDARVINEIAEVAKIIIDMQKSFKERIETAEKTASAIIETFSETLPTDKQNEEIFLNEDSLETKLISGMLLLNNSPEYFEKIVLDLSKKPEILTWNKKQYPDFINKKLEETGLLEQISPKFTELEYLFDEVNPLNPVAITDCLLSKLLLKYSQISPIPCVNFCKDLVFLNKRPIIQNVCWEIIQQIQPPTTLGYLLQTVFNLLETTQYPRPVIKTLTKIAAKGSLQTFILIAQKILEKPTLTQNHLPIIEELINHLNSQYRQEIITILKAYLSIGTCADSRNLATKTLLTEAPEYLKNFVDTEFN